MSAATNPDWLFAQQEKGFVGQLHDGIRGLLIDAHYGAADRERDGEDRPLGPRRPGARGLRARSSAPRRWTRRCASATGSSTRPTTGPRQVYLCHRFCELGAIPLTTAFTEIRDFLAANPSEVVVIVVEDYVAPSDIAAAAEKTGLIDYVYKGPLAEPLPTPARDRRDRAEAR